ncbi:MAG: hypothetical protein E7315_05230 [Clostridiales bacterium]|nr:hypothetical protein [Clostridiales bacterium]
MGKEIKNAVIIFFSVVLFAVISVILFFQNGKDETLQARVRINVVSALYATQIENAKIYCPQSGLEYLPNEEFIIDAEMMHPYKIFPCVFVVEAQGYLKSVVYAFTEISGDKCSTLTVNMFEDDKSLGISAVPLVISPGQNVTEYIAGNTNFNVD